MYLGQRKMMWHIELCRKTSWERPVWNILVMGG